MTPLKSPREIAEEITRWDNPVPIAAAIEYAIRSERTRAQSQLSAAQNRIKKLERVAKCAARLMSVTSIKGQPERDMLDALAQLDAEEGKDENGGR